MKVRIVELHKEDAFYGVRDQIEGQVVDTLPDQETVPADRFPEGIDYNIHKDEKDEWVYMQAKLEKRVVTPICEYAVGEPVYFYKVRIEEVP